MWKAPSFNKLKSTHGGVIHYIVNGRASTVVDDAFDLHAPMLCKKESGLIALSRSSFTHEFALSEEALERRGLGTRAGPCESARPACTPFLTIPGGAR